jgi:hypothetical protein
MKLQELLRRHSVIGIVGNRSSGKSMLTLSKLKEVREAFPSIPVYVLGTERQLEGTLQSLGMSVLHSEMDILDLQLKDCVIFIDEFATLFDTATKSKQLDKLERFFDRVEHNNVKLIIGTAREGFWNKFACARITAFLVKETEYSSLVNGTWLKERVTAIVSKSDYRLECPKNTGYIVSNKGEPTQRFIVNYDETLDSKKDNISLFADKKVKKDDGKAEE